MNQGMVYYCDGGARPTNPGFGGSGIHGYMYSEELPKKGAGQGDVILTADGYVPKADIAELVVAPVEVTPIEYYDGFVSFANAITNNMAELVAATEALIHAKQFTINRVHIQTDSEYVRKGMEGWMVSWERNNWRARDGSPVKNAEAWQRLAAAKHELENRGVRVDVKWVRGHNGDLGNERADRLATLGCMRSRLERKDFMTMEASKPEGYWKSENERHPFISSRNIYFNTGTDMHEPGLYYTGDHGSEDDIYCKRTSEGSYAIVQLKTPDPLVESVIKHQQEMAGGDEHLVMMRLDNVFRPDTYKEVSAWGSLAMVHSDPDRMDLYCLDHTKEDPRPITREFKPAKLAMRAVETTALLEEKLNDFLSNNGRVESTDLTAILYETVTKTPKKGEPVVSKKFNTKFNVGFAALPVEARFKGPDGVDKTAPVILSLGIDMLPRNPLKRLEDMNPVVTLITWADSDDVFRYATVIQTDGDVGIFCGIYSNIRVVPR